MPSIKTVESWPDHVLLIYSICHITSFWLCLCPYFLSFYILCLAFKSLSESEGLIQRV